MAYEETFEEIIRKESEKEYPAGAFGKWDSNEVHREIFIEGATFARSVDSKRIKELEEALTRIKGILDLKSPLFSDENLLNITNEALNNKL